MLKRIGTGCKLPVAAAAAAAAAAVALSFVACSRLDARSQLATECATEKKKKEKENWTPN